ncbi:hypothetical protein AcV7_010207 [Taiwanofungus camphoratus]|nr:hypothetical protein AcV7_010207 [Antrodia cinnamomea]
MLIQRLIWSAVSIRNPSLLSDLGDGNVSKSPDNQFAHSSTALRICPGRWLAIDAVWITVATVAASFNISRWLDEKGNPIDLSAQSARAPQMQHYPTFSCCCCVDQANRRRCLVSYL